MLDMLDYMALSEMNTVPVSLHPGGRITPDVKPTGSIMMRGGLSTYSIRGEKSKILACRRSFDSDMGFDIMVSTAKSKYVNLDDPKKNVILDGRFTTEKKPRYFAGYLLIELLSLGMCYNIKSHLRGAIESVILSPDFKIRSSYEGESRSIIRGISSVKNRGGYWEEYVPESLENLDSLVGKLLSYPPYLEAVFGAQYHSKIVNYIVRTGKDV